MCIRDRLCDLLLLGGRFEGRMVEGYNMLNGSLEADKIFQVGDEALVVINYSGEEILSVNMIDHYRLDLELLLGLCFALFLVLFAGCRAPNSVNWGNTSA